MSEPHSKRSPLVPMEPLVQTGVPNNLATPPTYHRSTSPANGLGSKDAEGAEEEEVPPLEIPTGNLAHAMTTFFNGASFPISSSPVESMGSMGHSSPESRLPPGMEDMNSDVGDDDHTEDLMEEDSSTEEEDDDESSVVDSRAERAARRLKRPSSSNSNSPSPVSYHLGGGRIRRHRAAKDKAMAANKSLVELRKQKASSGLRMRAEDLRISRAIKARRREETLAARAMKKIEDSEKMQARRLERRKAHAGIVKSNRARRDLLRRSISHAKALAYVAHTVATDVNPRLAPFLVERDGKVPLVPDCYRGRKSGTDKLAFYVDVPRGLLNIYSPSSLSAINPRHFRYVPFRDGHSSPSDHSIRVKKPTGALVAGNYPLPYEFDLEEDPRFEHCDPKLSNAICQDWVRTMIKENYLVLSQISLNPRNKLSSDCMVKLRKQKEAAGSAFQPEPAVAVVVRAEFSSHLTANFNTNPSTVRYVGEPNSIKESYKPPVETYSYSKWAVGAKRTPDSERVLVPLPLDVAERDSAMIVTENNQGDIDGFSGRFISQIRACVAIGGVSLRFAAHAWARRHIFSMGTVPLTTPVPAELQETIDIVESVTHSENSATMPRSGCKGAGEAFMWWAVVKFGGRVMDCLPLTGRKEARSFGLRTSSAQLVLKVNNWALSADDIRCCRGLKIACSEEGSALMDDILREASSLSVPFHPRECSWLYGLDTIVLARPPILSMVLCPPDELPSVDSVPKEVLWQRVAQQVRFARYSGNMKSRLMTLNALDHRCILGASIASEPLPQEIIDEAKQIRGLLARQDPGDFFHSNRYETAKIIAVDIAKEIWKSSGGAEAFPILSDPEASPPTKPEDLSVQDILVNLPNGLDLNGNVGFLTSNTNLILEALATLTTATTPMTKASEAKESTDASSDLEEKLRAKVLKAKQTIRSRQPRAATILGSNANLDGHGSCIMWWEWVLRRDVIESCAPFCATNAREMVMVKPHGSGIQMERVRVNLFSRRMSSSTPFCAISVEYPRGLGYLRDLCRRADSLGTNEKPLVLMGHHPKAKIPKANRKKASKGGTCPPNFFVASKKDKVLLALGTVPRLCDQSLFWDHPTIIRFAQEILDTKGKGPTTKSRFGFVSFRLATTDRFHIPLGLPNPDVDLRLIFQSEVLSKYKPKVLSFITKDAPCKFTTEAEYRLADANILPFRYPTYAAASFQHGERIEGTTEFDGDVILEDEEVEMINKAIAGPTESHEHIRRAKASGSLAAGPVSIPNVATPQAAAASLGPILTIPTGTPTLVLPTGSDTIILPTALPTVAGNTAPSPAGPYLTRSSGFR